MAEKLTTFYVLHGDDSIAVEEAVARLRAGMGEGPNADLNIGEFDGQQAGAAEVVNAASSYPFLADRRLVIVKGLLSWITRKGAGSTGKKELELLTSALPELPPHARLVFVEQGALPENNAVVKLAKSHAQGYERLFKVPRDTSGWIVARARDAYGAQIEPAAAAALAAVTAEDLRRADNELLKLAAYVDGARAITEADVALLTSYVPEANVFAMIDALANGDGRQALELMHRSLNENPRDDGFGLFALIVRQFRLLLLVREYLAAGGRGSGAAIAEAVGLRSNWQAEKLARQARDFTVPQLEQIYRLLQKYDLEMKTGRIQPRLALDLIVASLAGRD